MAEEPKSEGAAVPRAEVERALRDFLPPGPPDARVDAVGPIVARIRPLMAGQHPAVQGAVLADLLAIWIAGHDPAFRESILERHVAAVRTLVPVNAAMIRGE